MATKPGKKAAVVITKATLVPVRRSLARVVGRAYPIRGRLRRGYS